MAINCDVCAKGIHTVAFSRHKKGSSGASGVWALRAQITKRVQRPNLHTYKGLKFCTKCLRMIKAAEAAKATKKTETPTEQPTAQA